MFIDTIKRIELQLICDVKVGLINSIKIDMKLEYVDTIKRGLDQVDYLDKKIGYWRLDKLYKKGEIQG